MGSSLKALVAALVSTLVGMLPAWVNQIDFGLVAQVPYKHKVTGSNPVSPTRTKQQVNRIKWLACFSFSVLFCLPEYAISKQNTQNWEKIALLDLLFRANARHKRVHYTEGYHLWRISFPVAWT